MQELGGYVKFSRKIKNWTWYKDAATFKLFFHLITFANFSENTFLGVTIKRGQIARSYRALADETGLTLKQVRTAINHLKRTQEVAQETYQKFSVFTVKNYDKYQSGAQQGAGEGHSRGTARAHEGHTKGQQIKNIYKNDNNDKNEKKYKGAAPADGARQTERQPDWMIAGFGSEAEHKKFLEEFRR